ncbi:SH3 domain-containing protein [Mesorhizobium sp. M0027]|uniref:SH3 domain-containing protein n=1 Tax=Mesorhizobium sp. M0027 TaxID=2956848 RepID=UPI00333D482E
MLRDSTRGTLLIFGLTQRRLVAYKNRLACDGVSVPGRAFGNATYRPWQMIRRTITLRSPLLALIAAPLMLAGPPASAQEPEPIISIVTGLAPGDLLNVRATASAMGKIEARLPIGSSVKNLGCGDVSGHRWCKVEDIDDPKLSGWAPARYLDPINPQQVTPQATANTESPASQPLPDLTTRLGATAPETALSSADAIGRVAIEDAYRLALAAGNPSTGQVDGSAPAAADPVQNFGAANAAPPPDAQTVARLQPPGTPVPGNGNAIPCARYLGQPMTSCKAAVVRTGDKIDVTVTWPDGGTRIISFRAGKPAGADAPGEFRFTREGSLNMIRIGASERFEITDALALGDSGKGIRQ